MSDPVYNENVNNEAESRGQTTQAVAPAHVASDQGNNSSLHWLQENEIQELRSRWMNIQGQFVDEPRSAVEQADALVADAMERIQNGFNSERQLLDHHWTNNSDVSTEDLRTILQDYRAFFNRLLSL